MTGQLWDRHEIAQTDQGIRCKFPNVAGLSLGVDSIGSAFRYWLRDESTKRYSGPVHPKEGILHVRTFRGSDYPEALYWKQHLIEPAPRVNESDLMWDGLKVKSEFSIKSAALRNNRANDFTVTVRLDGNILSIPWVVERSSMTSAWVVAIGPENEGRLIGSAVQLSG